MRFRELLTISILLIAGDGFAAPAVVLSWEPMPGATGYDVQVAADPGFAAPIVSATGAAPTYEWRTLPERVYYWRVRCRYSFGRQGEWSAVRAIPRAVFPVAITSPKPDEQIVCAEGCRVRLAFASSPALAEYRVELTRDADAEFLVPILDVRVSAVDFVEWAPDDTGAYRWRVSAIDLLGRPVPAASVAHLVLTPPPPPPLPIVVTVATPVPVSTVIAGPPIADLAHADLSPLFSMRIEGSAAPSAPVEREVGSEPVSVPSTWPFAAAPSVSAGAGWRSNFARATDVTPVVTMSQDVRGELTAGVALSSFRASGRLADGTRASADVVEAAFHAGIGKPVGDIDVSFHAGPVLQVVRGRVGDAAELGVTGGVGGGVQLAGPLGSARWILGADVRNGHWNGRYTELSTGGALLSAGVRFQ